MVKKILIVIDVQNDFLKGGSLAVFNDEEIESQTKMIDNINKLLRSDFFYYKIATQDNHPENHISFASTHDKNVYEQIDVSYGKQVLWPAHCVRDTNGVNFPNQLDDTKFNAIIRKGMNKNIDSYSAFYENDKKTIVGLNGLLQGLKEKDEELELYFCGIATDYCVYYSIMDAHKLGYKCNIIIDACKEVSEEGKLNTMCEFAFNGIKIIDSKKIF